MSLACIDEVKNLMHFLEAEKIRINTISSCLILTKFHHDKIAKIAPDNKITFE